jgi:hypothetical protein
MDEGEGEDVVEDDNVESEEVAMRAHNMRFYQQMA